MSIMKREVYCNTDMALQAIRTMPNCFVPTGSRVYGGFSQDSDHDFVVNPEVTWFTGEIMRGLISCWKSSGVHMDDQYTCLVPSTCDYVEEAIQDGVRVEIVENPKDVVYLKRWPDELSSRAHPVINLIFVESKAEFASWVRATEALVALRGKDRERLENSKEARVLAFRVLRGVFMKGA